MSLWSQERMLRKQLLNTNTNLNSKHNMEKTEDCRLEKGSSKYSCIMANSSSIKVFYPHSPHAKKLKEANILAPPPPRISLMCICVCGAWSCCWAPGIWEGSGSCASTTWTRSRTCWSQATQATTESFNQFGVKATTESFNQFGVKAATESFNQFGVKATRESFNQFGVKATRESFNQFGVKAARESFNQFGVKATRESFN